MSQTTLSGVMEILLVEDNLEDARLTIEALKRKDVQCQVQLVCDGEEALDFLQEKGIFAGRRFPTSFYWTWNCRKKAVTRC